jgi:hypothetical protein
MIFPLRGGRTQRVLQFHRLVVRLWTRSIEDIDGSVIIADIQVLVIAAEDQGTDLWVVFNRVQEKILGGSYTSGGRKARSVKNFLKDIQLNEQLFELAESYL